MCADIDHRKRGGIRKGILQAYAYAYDPSVWPPHPQLSMCMYTGVTLFAGTACVCVHVCANVA